MLSGNTKRGGNRGRNTFMGNTRYGERRARCSSSCSNSNEKRSYSPCRMRVMDIWMEDDARDLSVSHLNALIIHFTREGGGDIYPSIDLSPISTPISIHREFPLQGETIVG